MYRFRTGDNGELVLQVLVKHGEYQWGVRTPNEWRDATIADIPVADPFAREPREQLVGGSVGFGGTD